MSVLWMKGIQKLFMGRFPAAALMAQPSSCRRLLSNDMEKVEGKELRKHLYRNHNVVEISGRLQAVPKFNYDQYGSAVGVQFYLKVLNSNSKKGTFDVNVFTSLRNVFKYLFENPEADTVVTVSGRLMHKPVGYNRLQIFAFHINVEGKRGAFMNAEKQE